MPTFYIRSVATQTLIDSNDYEITADTLDKAKAMLEAAQATAQDTDNPVAVDGIRRVFTRGIGDQPVVWMTEGDGNVRVLDPTEISDGDNWLTVLDSTTGARLYADEEGKAGA